MISWVALLNSCSLLLRSSVVEKKKKFNNTSPKLIKPMVTVSRRWSPTYRKKLFSLGTAAARFLDITIARDPTLKHLTLADRSLLVCATLQQLKKTFDVDKISLQLAVTAVAMQNHHISTVPKIVAAAYTQYKNEERVSEKSKEGHNKSETQNNDDPNKPPTFDDSPLGFSPSAARAYGPNNISEAFDDENLFTAARNTWHYPLLADWDLCAEIESREMRLATIFQLIRDHGFEHTYSREQIDAAYDAASKFDDAFLETFNLTTSYADEYYARRRLLRDKSLHGMLMSGTTEELRFVSWILLFDTMGFRFPRRPRHEGAPQIAAAYGKMLEKNNTSVLKDLPYLERIAAFLKHPEFAAVRVKADSEHLQFLSQRREQRQDKGDKVLKAKTKNNSKTTRGGSDDDDGGGGLVQSTTVTPSDLLKEQQRPVDQNDGDQHDDDSSSPTIPFAESDTRMPMWQNPGLNAATCQVVREKERQLVEAQQQQRQQQHHHHQNQKPKHGSTSKTRRGQGTAGARHASDLLNQSAWDVWTRRESDKVFCALPVFDVTSSSTKLDSFESRKDTSLKPMLEERRGRARDFLNELYDSADKLQQDITKTTKTTKLTKSGTSPTTTAESDEEELLAIAAEAVENMTEQVAQRILNDKLGPERAHVFGRGLQELAMDAFDGITSVRVAELFIQQAREAKRAAEAAEMLSEEELDLVRESVRRLDLASFVRSDDAADDDADDQKPKHGDDTIKWSKSPPRLSRTMRKCVIAAFSDVTEENADAICLSQESALSPDLVQLADEAMRAVPNAQHHGGRPAKVEKRK